MTKSECLRETPMASAFLPLRRKLRRLNACVGMVGCSARALGFAIGQMGPRGSMADATPRTPPIAGRDVSGGLARATAQKSAHALPTLFGIADRADPSKVFIGRGVMGPLGGGMAEAMPSEHRARAGGVL